MSLPSDIVISVLVVRLIVDEVGLPKKLLFRVLELADHVDGLLLVLLVDVLWWSQSRSMSSSKGIKTW